MLIVVAAAVSSTGVGKAGVSTGQVAMAICLTVSLVLIVGLEGMWGTIFTVCVFLPITQFIVGKEENGVHEDTLDAFKIVYVLMCNVTNITSAIVRTILEDLRTLCIWVVKIILFYSTGAPDMGGTRRIPPPIHRNAHV